MKLLLDQNLSFKLGALLEDVFPWFSARARGPWLTRSSRRVNLDTCPRAWIHFIIVTKDDDFRQLSAVRGAPPKVVWLDVGNCSTPFVANLLRQNVAAISEFIAEADAALMILTRVSAERT